MKRIKGKVKYVDLNTGFWSLIDEQGNNYEPVNMPEDMKRDGAIFSVEIKEIKDATSRNMFGIIVKILDFKILH